METKIKVMDEHIHSLSKVGVDDLFQIVQTIFGFNLDNIPILPTVSGSASKTLSTTALTSKITNSRAIISSHLNQNNEGVTGEDIRRIINQVFGINLDAISSLAGARISLFSKGHWVLQHEKDLFVVHTLPLDIEVIIYPTPYFSQVTGINELPNQLIHSLVRLGFSFNESIGSYHYKNPSGDPVPDSFKGQTIRSILHVIQTKYTHI
jgi:hypothetical protein